MQSRKPFPLHLSNDFSQISALLFRADLIQDANKSKVLLLSNRHFSSICSAVKGVSHRQWEKGVKSSLSILILTIHITSTSKPKQDEYLNCLQTQIMLNRVSASPFIMQGAQEGRIYLLLIEYSPQAIPIWLLF